MTPPHQVVHQVELGLGQAVAASSAQVEVQVTHGHQATVERGVGVDGIYKVCVLSAQSGGRSGEHRTEVLKVVWKLQNYFFFFWRDHVTKGRFIILNENSLSSPGLK